jgi:PAS domain-containing protein
MTPGAIPEAQVRTGDLLQDGESRLRLALAAADLGIWDWDVATGRMVYSQRAKEICGFAQEQDVTFDMAKAVTHPDDYPFTSAQAARALDPEIRDRSPFEYRIVKADGSVCWSATPARCRTSPKSMMRRRSCGSSTLRWSSGSRHAPPNCSRPKRRGAKPTRCTAPISRIPPIRCS